MPETSHRAAEALSTPHQPDRSTAVLRIALGAIFALSVLSIPQLATPEPVAAGSSCTGWTSQASPPQSIRVLRTRTGRIETVDFRKYVAEVMASGEWPSRLKRATLEAGALATKQYAWFHTMKGHHRPGYVRNGKCYDVRDDTNDQLYRPDRAKPTARQQRAIDKTWGLTLRKSGRFFLTGYRAGVVRSCAGDANGWKLFAKSVNNCANKGWSSKRILTRYLNPNLGFVWSDKTGPVVKKPSIALKVGNTIADGAATLFWQPVSKDADIDRYKLQRKVGRGSWKDVALEKQRAWKADVWLKVGTKTRFRIRAKDSKGNLGPWSYGPRRKASIRGPVGLTLAGDGVEAAATEPLKVKTRFSGRSIAYVTRTGPGMGQAKVFVNGKKVATVDLERETVTGSELVWAKNWSAVKTRSVAVKAVTPDERVDFEGFFVLR